MKFSSFVFLGALLLGSACVVETPTSDEGTAEPRIAASEDGLLYIVTRQDFRKCVHPLCGGVWVKALNQGKTACADGSSAEECYVGVTDLDGLGLSPDQLEDLASAWENSNAILAGDLIEVKTHVGVAVGSLVATDAWLGLPGKSSNSDTFVLLSSAGDGVQASGPNGASTQTAQSIDFEATGATDDQIGAALEELAADSLLVAGEANGDTVTATAIFRKLTGLAPLNCGGATCAFGTTCCNNSCGVCAPPGAQCLDVVCPDPD